MSNSLSITPSQAQNGISPHFRNNLYSALLSGEGIRNIEATLEEDLRSTGFLGALREYINHLYRSGQAATAEEALNIAMAEIRKQTKALKSHGATNGTNSNINGNANGNGDAADLDLGLKVPDTAINKGSKAIRRELERVCDVAYEDE